MSLDKHLQEHIELGLDKEIEDIKKLAMQPKGGGGGGASDFTDLSDTPDSYSGQGSRLVKVKADETGLEFVPGGEAEVAWGQISGTLADQTDLQSALDAKASTTNLTNHINNTSNPHNVTKTQVGLGNVDNTSDANKPISSATQTALDSKLDDSQLDTDGTLATNSDSKIATQKATKTYADTKVAANASITGATKTKVTYDSKGLVTAGADATTSDISEGSNLYFTNSRADARITAQKGVADGIASLGSDGKVPSSQLPAIALTDVFVVNSEAAQLALTAQEGDVAVRTDQNKSYAHNGGTAGTMSDWQELLTPTDTVLSVNGQTGTVTLTTTEISEGTNLYHTTERAQDAVGSALTDTATVDLTYNDGAGTITADVVDDSISNTKLANMAQSTIKGRASGAGTGDPTDLSASQVKTLLSLDNVPNVDTREATITFIIDGGGSAISTGIKGDLEIPFACTINRATALADQVGDIQVDVWKDTYANFPPTDADSITASAPVTISGANKSQDSTLTGWTTSIAAGDTLRFNVDSVATVQRVTVSLKVTRT